MNLLVGCQDGLKFLDRSGQGEVYTLHANRPFKQIDVLEQLNVAITVSGKKDKLRCYYLSNLRSKIIQVNNRDGGGDEYIDIDNIQNVTMYKYVQYERIRFLIVLAKHTIEVYAWAPKPYSKFMKFKSYTGLKHKPLVANLTVEEGTRLKVIYGSDVGFHAIDCDQGHTYDLFLPNFVNGPVTPHSITVLNSNEGHDLLLCYDDEGVYVNTYGLITKDVLVQWGERPLSVANIGSGNGAQLMGWGEKAIEIRVAETGHLDGVFMHKKTQKLKFLCERNEKVFFASVQGRKSQIYFMALNRQFHYVSNDHVQARGPSHH